jgi:hypothetical protein
MDMNKELNRKIFIIKIKKKRKEIDSNLLGNLLIELN